MVSARLLAHQQRHDRQVRQQAAEKRQLHLERVLARVRADRRVHDGIGRGDRRPRRRVDRDRPERRRERALGVERDAVEADEMRRPDQHGDVVSLRRRRLVGVGGYRPGEHDAGVRRDDGVDLAGGRRHGGVEVPVDFAPQRPR